MKFAYSLDWVQLVTFVHFLLLNLFQIFSKGKRNIVCMGFCSWNRGVFFFFQIGAENTFNHLLCTATMYLRDFNSIGPLCWHWRRAYMYVLIMQLFPASYWSFFWHFTRLYTCWCKCTSFGYSPCLRKRIILSSFHQLGYTRQYSIILKNSLIWV